MGVLEDVKNEYAASVSKSATETLKKCEGYYAAVPQPTTLDSYVKIIKLLESTLTAVKPLDYSIDAANLKPLLEDKFKKEIDDWKKEEYDINTKYEDILDDKIQTIEDEAKDINSKKRAELDENNKVYIELEAKRKQLESYSDDIIEICSANGITTSDVDIDNSSFTVEELGSVYDQYLEFIRKKANKVNIITIFREKLPSVYLELGVICAVVFLCIAVRPLMDIGAVCLFIALIRSQSIQKKKMKSYIVLYGLVFNIRPMEMGFKGEVDESELVTETVDEDNDERLAGVAEEWQQALDEHDNKDPNIPLEDERAKLAGSLSAIQKEYDEQHSKFIAEKEKLVNNITTKLDSIKADFAKKKESIQLLGSTVSKSAVLNTNFILGCHDEVFEETMEIGLKNIIIKPTKDLALHKQFLQVLLANALTGVAASSINVVVCDPNRQGQELISFYNSDLENVIQFSDKTLEEDIKELKKFAEANLKAMKGKDITTYNKEAEATGRTPRDYRLLIVLSQPKKMEEDEALVEFMKFSANLGVIVWLVSNKTLPDTKIFNVPFEGVAHPYPINTDTFGPKVSQMLAEAVKKGSSGGLMWKDYLSRTVTDADVWAYKGDDCIELRPGFCDGDPTQFKGYTFGNQGNVHMLGVGTTGAGKSVFLNFLICETTLRYDPRSYELWLVDYKGNEFSKYLPRDGSPNILPHIKACLCTSDGDYAGSLFTALRKECERRFDYFKDLGLKNLKQYNEKVRAKADTAANEAEREEIINQLIPRILCVNDEFQVIFQTAEPKVIDKMKEDIKYISKLGRAAGVHLFFTSQDMKGTLDESTMNQFSLRFALRCEESVSQQLLGCNLASTIRQTNGYLYVKSFEDKKPEQMKRYRTPYLCDEGPDEKHPNNVDELKEHIDKMAELAKEKHIPKKSIITYQESTKHSIEEVNTFYETVQGIPDNFFLIGERMTYSTNRAPENIVLTCANNMHIFSAFDDQSDLINFYRTIKLNISKQEGAAMLINCQVADLHYLCELDIDVSEDKQFLSNEKISVKRLMKEVYQPILTARTESKKKDTPVYLILIGWDKAMGFGVDRDANLTGDFTVFLQTCGEYNIHVIFICSGTGQIPSSLIEACKFKIAGKVSENDSFKLLDNKQGSKSYSGLKNGYLFINRDKVVTRAKIYQTELKREVKGTEFVL